MDAHKGQRNWSFISEWVKLGTSAGILQQRCKLIWYLLLAPLDSDPLCCVWFAIWWISAALRYAPITARGNGIIAGGGIYSRGLFLRTVTNVIESCEWRRKNAIIISVIYAILTTQIVFGSNYKRKGKAESVSLVLAKLGMGQIWGRCFPFGERWLTICRRETDIDPD